MDYMEIDKQIVYTMRGTFKISVIAFIEEPMVGRNTIAIMKDFCQTVAMKHYGKSASQIYDEVKRMNVDQAMDWVEKVWGRYINDKDISSILNKYLNGKEK